MMERLKSLSVLGRRMAMIGLPVVILTGGAITVGVMAATAPKPERKQEEAKPMAVQVATTEARPMRISVTVQGEVRPQTQARLAPQASGRIVWVSPAFVEGGAFAAGDALVRIDSADYELAVVRAQAQVAQAEEALAREEAEAELARRDWEALGQGTPSPLALREPQMAQARATLASAQASLRDAELQLSRTVVRAPFAGRVMSRSANLGDTVAMGAPIAEIFATEVMEVRVPLTDEDLSHLETPVGFIANARNRGPTATITATVAGESATWTGRLVRTEASVDPRTRVVFGVVEARGGFSRDASAPLAPGLFATVTLQGPREEMLIAAPRGALKRNENVFVVRADDTIEIRTVQAAQTSAEEFFVREGLRAGERVVVSPMPSAQAGMKVTPVARTATTLEAMARS